jgi:hypothetical protein
MEHLIFNATHFWSDWTNFIKMNETFFGEITKDVSFRKPETKENRYVPFSVLKKILFFENFKFSF